MTAAGTVAVPLGSEALRVFQAELPDTELRPGEPLSRHTSFRVGGPADLLALPRTTRDVSRLVTLCRELGLPITRIGNGTNLVIRDGGIRGVVLKVAENLAAVEFAGRRCTSQAGALLAQVSRASAVRSLSGLEFAVGIPGTIGGGVMMNAGAYGGEMREVVTHVTVVDEEGRTRRLSAPELEFGYRRSLLQQRPWVVVELEMELQPDDPERITAQMAVKQYAREWKQPLDYPSAGSVFKRPPGRYVGPMVEQLGLKGYRIGGAMVSPKHAGFIVNAGGATAADILALIEHVRSRVQERFDVTLETEVRIIGENPSR